MMITCVFRGFPSISWMVPTEMFCFYPNTLCSNFSENIFAKSVQRALLSSSKICIIVACHKKIFTRHCNRLWVRVPLQPLRFWLKWRDIRSEKVLMKNAFLVPTSHSIFFTGTRYSFMTSKKCLGGCMWVCGANVQAGKVRSQHSVRVSLRWNSSKIYSSKASLFRAFGIVWVQGVS